MPTDDIPSREQLVERVAGVADVVRGHAGWAEQNRRLHDDVIAALEDAGVFRLRTPKHYGGFECDTRTLVDVASEIGRADGSAAWVSSVSWIPTWMACMFPDAVQDEVFAEPDVRVCGTLSPGAMAAPAAGGIVVDGRWGFISGAHHAGWQVIIAILAAADVDPYPVAALVPMSELLVVDDWDSHGLRGSGSVSTVAKGLFVPEERVLPLPTVLEGRTTSSRLADTAIYRAPLLPVASACSVGPVLGLTRAAADLFTERLPHRKITYTAYERQREAPITHLQLADAATRADEAAFHAHRVADLVDTQVARGTEWKIEQRVQARAELGAVVRRGREAVEGLARASGGSSVHRAVPMQRFAADVRAVELHALMAPDTNAELHGRLLAGLEPNTLYV